VRHNLGLVSAIAGDTATARQLLAPELSTAELDSLALVAAALREGAGRR
jgi:Flp pilus assembly protein TadD